MKKLRVEPLEARILGILKDWYPITVEELRDELGVSKVVLERALKALMVKGVVQLEPLSDKTYIRLLVPEVVFDTEKKGKKKPPPPKDTSWDDALMYA
jgi:predicted ArsR family transcriptional regulator